MSGADIASPGRGATNGGHDRGETGENVLVLSSGTDGTESHCTDRRSSSGTVTQNLLLVSLDGAPGRRLDAVVREGAEGSTNVGVVCCEGTRHPVTARSTDGPGADAEPWVATVPSAGDLTGIGIRIEQALSAWSDATGPVELRFHSLTTLCRLVDDRSAFRFCHAVTRHLDAVGASSRFHLDPRAVDDRTVATLSALFDRVEDRT